MSATINKEPVGFRKQTDSFGEVDVSSDKLWGAQTQRAGMLDDNLDRLEDALKGVYRLALGGIFGGGSGAGAGSIIGLTTMDRWWSMPSLIALRCRCRRTCHSTSRRVSR